MVARSIAHAGLIGAAVAALSAAHATAQVVTFSTSGTFSAGSCTATTCSFAGFTLTYTGLSSASWTAPTDVDLGSFSTLCTSCAPGSSASILAGSTFTLTINQTGPGAGSGSFGGAVTGTLGWNPSSSSLFWNPDSGTMVIDGVTYSLIEKDQGGGTFGINISAPNVNNNPNSTDVKAGITSTPEPATLALMATGLLVVAPMARRRRRR